MCPSSNEGALATPAASDIGASAAPRLAVPPTPYWLRSDAPVPLMLAPCVLYALALTLGILVDHFFEPRLAWTFLGAGIGVFAWLISRMGRHSSCIQDRAMLCLICRSLGAALPITTYG